jgi:hypothetical protein
VTVAEKEPNWNGLLYKTAAAALAIVLAALTGWLVGPDKVVTKTVIKEVEKAPAEYAPTFGWHYDPDAISENQDPDKTLQFAATPAGRAVTGDEDVFLWQAVAKAAAGGFPWVNQESVGCCVGCGFKHCVDVLLAVQIAQGRAAEWKPVSVEVIYGGSRVEVGGGRISGDGSVGAWAAQWVKTYGVVPMEKFDAADLSTFSPARAREFGRRGVPDALEPAAREHPVKGVALVTTWADVKRAVQQGYPVAVCSDQGFRMERDADGFCRKQGTWYHCMAVIGVRGGARPGGFVLNSWGDRAHTGPVWPAGAPAAGFWADSQTIDRMVRQGDSFALSDAVGFPARKLDWIIRAAPARERDPFAMFARPEFALAP